jgi:Fic family protein
MYRKRHFSIHVNPFPSRILPLESLSPQRFETPEILKKLNAASRRLAELNGVVESIPNRNILINTLAIQEAKDSSEIENIVTTHDELFQDDLTSGSRLGPAAKEVLLYREALRAGFEKVRNDGLLTQGHILEIQAVLEQNHAGFRKVPGTTLKNNAGEVVYTPPQHPDEIEALMSDLERFINQPELFDADPLIKMALLHHQFESIHPFYDGNGRTGRIINVLYLVKEGLLEIPVLYLSRHIVRTKTEYYRLLQAVRTDGCWEEWVLYMLTAVERTAAEAVIVIQQVKTALLETKRRIRDAYKFYSQDLINNLFNHPYTKIEYLERDLRVSRLTATNYLNELAAGGFLKKQKIGRTNYYVNVALTSILTGESMQRPELA